MAIKKLDHRGQATVELAVCLPVLLAVSLICMNALMFFSECAAFDRMVPQAVRTCAASPGYGKSQGELASDVERALNQRFSRGNQEISVSVSADGWGNVVYTATLQFEPTLFGLSLRSGVMGLGLPRLSHAASLAVSPFRAGVVL